MVFHNFLKMSQGLLASIVVSWWKSSGTSRGSVWNGSISSRVNARPIRTYTGTILLGTIPL